MELSRTFDINRSLYHGYNKHYNHYYVVIFRLLNLYLLYKIIENENLCEARIIHRDINKTKTIPRSIVK